MEANKKLASLLKQKYPKNIYIHIYSILKNSKHSINDNGIFFNLSDIPQENIQKCIEYIECIDYNVEDHIKNLNIREDIENKYKMDITSSKISGKRKQLEKKQVSKNEDSDLETLVQKKTYKGVYKRIDRVIRGLKPEEIKISKRKKKVEEIIDEEDEEELDDLFGEDEEDEEFGEDLEENIDLVEDIED